MAASSKSQPNKEPDFCTHFNSETSTKKVLECLHGRAPSDELRERRRRCFIATSYSSNDRDTMQVDESRTRRFTLAVTKEQESDFFKSLLSSVPEKSTEDSSVPKSSKYIDMSEDCEIMDGITESKRDLLEKISCDISGNHFADKSGLGLVRTGDDCGNAKDGNISRLNVEDLQVPNKMALCEGEVQKIKVSTQTGCDLRWRIVEDSNSMMTFFPDVEGNTVYDHSSGKSNVCERISMALNRNISECVGTRDVTQAKSAMITDGDIPKFNCSGQSSSMNARVIDADDQVHNKNDSMCMLTTENFLNTKTNLPNVDEGGETSENCVKSTRNVMTQTALIRKYNRFRSGPYPRANECSVRSESMVKCRRKVNYEKSLTNKLQSLNSVNNLNKNQRNSFGVMKSKRRPKLLYAGQRSKMTNQNDFTECVDLRSKLLHSRRYTCDQRGVRSDTEMRNGYRKNHTRNNNGVQNAKIQLQHRNSCRNCKASLHECVSNRSAPKYSDNLSTYGCSMQKTCNERKMNIASIDSRMPKKHNNQSHIDVNACGSNYLRQDIPIVVADTEWTFCRSTNGQELKEKCSYCHDSNEDASSFGLSSEDVVEMQEKPFENAYRNDITHGSSVFCAVCSVKGNSTKQMSSHYNGIRHLRMLRATEMKRQYEDDVTQSTQTEDMTQGKVEPTTGNPKHKVKVFAAETYDDELALIPVREYMIVRKNISSGLTLHQCAF